MTVPLPHDDQLRALLAGLVYTLLCTLASHAARSASRWLDRTTDPGLQRLRQWQAWPFLAQSARISLALGFPFWMLLTGVFSASDVGLQSIDRDGPLLQLLGVIGGAAAWLALLWCAHWRQRQKTTPLLEQDQGSWASVLSNLLSQTADAASYRGGLMPLLGPYWGVWLSVVWKMLASLTHAKFGSRLRTGGQREYVFLDWALDWVGAALYMLSGSLLAALLGRAISLLAVVTIARHMCSHRAHRGSTTSTHDQRQDHQGGKHGDGQDGESLQVT